MKKRIQPLLKQLSIIVVLMAIISVSEALTVIYDSGNTQPMSRYLPQRFEQEHNSESRQSPLKKEQKTSAYTLPITTPSLSPGVVTASPKALRYLQQPLFLVGSDKRSKNWLIEKREQLIQLGAVGLLIQAEDKKDVKAMFILAQGLRLVPASAEGFAAELGLTHYPILLSNQGWEQ
jgi:integrating conjugative element protein (TIGR03765 family)